MTLAVVLTSCIWLMANPAGDQPLLALVERATGIGPARFLSPAERDVYESAARDSLRFQAEVDRLDSMEKAARTQPTPLADDEIRRIASYQKSFNEMTSGEHFVQDTLRGKARMRERWIIGLPGALIAFAGLAWLARRFWPYRLPSRNKGAVNCG